MKQIILLFGACFVLVFGSPQTDRREEYYREGKATIDDPHDLVTKHHDDGNWSFSYRTSNNIEVHQESESPHIVKGEYSYIDPDGRLVKVTYIAGAGIGFVPQSTIIDDAIIKSVELNLQNPPLDLEEEVEQKSKKIVEQLVKPVERRVTNSVIRPIVKAVKDVVETVVESLENPEETLLEVSEEIPVVEAVDQALDTLIETPVEAIVETPIEAIVETPVEAIVETPVESPIEISVKIPEKITEAAPIETPEEIPVKILVETPTTTTTPTPRRAPAQRLLSRLPARVVTPSKTQIEEKISTDEKVRNVAVRKINRLRKLQTDIVKEVEKVVDSVDEVVKDTVDTLDKSLDEVVVDVVTDEAV